MDFEIDQLQMQSLREAVRRNPAKVLSETKNFLTKGMAEYNKGVIRSPWRMGGSGGGAPVATGNLRDTHRREITQWEARIYPTADYAPYVHGIKGFPRKRTYQLRPWLDYVQQQYDAQIQILQGNLLNNLVNDLAK